MAKLLDKVKELKRKYKEQGLSDKEIIDKIVQELQVPVILVQVLYEIV